ncbi:putative secreted protein with C-terminal beta-propeller domain [Ilumatobacter fluminis]|uniref:Putative secreted protein with C-terminal beta-propeller domain n=1 Tax=Ilumatobacter fluminis TaxID=467091 RepID=A0A4R7I3D5_9ACTN|nr:beta-propeller domain-containing protein [Ilumatobacter fluminis]TDT17754.1 putative secreted protein with C-terminal beta-propeller domain [Ilumatobacter fluminis]
MRVGPGTAGLIALVVAATSITVGATSAAPPTESAGGGIRLGPLETSCIPVPDAEIGDLALMNVTAVRPTASGHLTAHHELADPSATSTVNFQADATVPALAAVAIGEHRVACVTNSIHAAAHVVVDLAGLLPGAAVDGSFTGSTRVFDSRRGPSSRVEPGETVCSEPVEAGPGAVVLANVTAANPSSAGHLVAHPRGAADTTSTSTLNYVAGANRANLTVVELGADSSICVTLSTHASANVVIDAVAVLDSTLFERTDAGGRLLDTREPDAGTAGRRVAAGGTVCTTDPVGTPGAAVVANVTAANASGPGHLNTHALEQASDGSSTHNYTASTSWANLTVTRLGDSGRLCVSAFVNPSHVVIDLVAVIAPDHTATINPVGDRLIDTRRIERIPGRLAASDLTFGASCDAIYDAFVDAHLGDLTAYSYPTLPATNGNGATTVPDHSETNTQVDGVDEGDFVETDGRYLYRESEPGTLEIIDLQRNRVASTVALDGDHAEMILYGDRLMVTTTGYSADTSTTNVLVADVTDPSNPTVLERYGVTGVREAMRGIDGRVHLVLKSYRIPYQRYWDDVEVPLGQIAASTIDDWLPLQYDIRDGAYTAERPAMPCERVGLPAASAGGELLWVSSIDLARPSAGQSGTAVMTKTGTTSVMATADRLYVSTQNFEWWDWWGNGSFVTGIHLFDLDGASATYEASTDVPGRVLNQFSMSEYDGILRVAVTSGWWNESSSAVFALRRSGDSFERISAVGELGPGERIYAVRHVGELSYVVTFRETDPLYVVDFADPLRPVLRGELKIPGFSTYLHPLGNGRLLGVGRDADPDTGEVIGSQLSLFDVADPDRPTRTSQIELPGWTEIHDHRAVLVWPAASTVVLPGYIDSTGGSVLHVGRYVGQRLIYAGAVYAPSCSNFTRGVVVGDRLIAVGSGPVQIVDLTTLAPITTIGSCS